MKSAPSCIAQRSGSSTRFCVVASQRESLSTQQHHHQRSQAPASTQSAPNNRCGNTVNKSHGPARRRRRLRRRLLSVSPARRGNGAAKSLNVTRCRARSPTASHTRTTARGAGRVVRLRIRRGLREGGQREIYEVVGSPLVHSALMGYNGTLLAYGQTGSGKTFTIGEMGRLGSAQGRRPPDGARALRGDCTRAILVLVEMQFVQVHIERIYDLLAERVSEHGHEVITPLSLREDRDGVFIQGAASLEAASADVRSHSSRLRRAPRVRGDQDERDVVAVARRLLAHRHQAGWRRRRPPRSCSARRWSAKRVQRRRLDGMRRAILRRNSPAHRPPPSRYPRRCPRPPTHEHPTSRAHRWSIRDKARLARHHRRGRRAHRGPSLGEVLGTDGRGRSASDDVNASDGGPDDLSVASPLGEADLVDHPIRIDGAPGDQGRLSIVDLAGRRTSAARARRARHPGRRSTHPLGAGELHRRAHRRLTGARPFMIPSDAAATGVVWRQLQDDADRLLLAGGGRPVRDAVHAALRRARAQGAQLREGERRRRRHRVSRAAAGPSPRRVATAATG